MPKKMNTTKVILFLCLLPLHNIAGDSLLYRSFCLRSDLSGSYFTERSWYGDPQSVWALRGMADMRLRRKTNSGNTTDHTFNSQLGYSRAADTIWLKSADVFTLHLRWLQAPRRYASHGWSLRLRSQCINTFVPAEDGRRWAGGFFNPAQVEAGYTIGWRFFKNSLAQLHIASIQVDIQPRNRIASAEEKSPFFTTRHSTVTSRYGFTGNLLIDERFYGEALNWQHQSRIFLNALHPDHIQFEVSNRLSIRFLKVFQLRIESGLCYQPEQSKQLQYKQEVLLGIFYDYRK